jgi:multidrug efflux system membrane fusion protein
VQRGSQGTYVYIVKADHSISLRLVKVGIIDGDTSSIDEGLTPGESVVVEGADKLRDGMTVEVGDKDAKPTAAAGAASAQPAQGGHGHRKNAASGSASAAGAASKGGA